MSIRLVDSQIIISDDQFHLLPLCTHQKPQSYQTSNDYSEYVLKCLPEINRENLVYYRLPKGLKVYVGHSKSTHMSLSNLTTIYLNAEDASNDGLIYEYRLQSDCEVLIMNRRSNLQVLTAQAIEDGQSNVVKTLTKGNYLSLTDYLCSRQISGFMVKLDMVCIVLCQSQKYLSDGQYSTLNQLFTKSIN